MTTRSEKFEILIEATPEDVWRCLTTKQGLEAWFGTKAEIELEIGGTRTIAWGDAMEMTGELTTIEPTQKLVVTFRAEGSDVGAEEWLIESSGTTTRLTLIHSMPDDGVENWDGFYGDIRRGWALFMRSMKFALESADNVERVALCRHVPASDRLATRQRVEELMAGAPKLIEGMTMTLNDPPHSLLLTAPDRSLIIDLEGEEPHMVVYLQAASHNGQSPWQEQVLDHLGQVG